MCTYQVLQMQSIAHQILNVLQANLYCSCITCVAHKTPEHTSSVVRRFCFISSVVHLFDLTTPIVVHQWGVVCTHTGCCSSQQMLQVHATENTKCPTVSDVVHEFYFHASTPCAWLHTLLEKLFPAQF